MSAARNRSLLGVAAPSVGLFLVPVPVAAEAASGPSMIRDWRARCAEFMSCWSRWLERIRRTPSMVLAYDAASSSPTKDRERIVERGRWRDSRDL